MFDSKAQLSSEGKIQYNPATGKIKLFQPCRDVQNWMVTVRIQLIGCIIYCHPTTGEGYHLSLDFTTDQETLKFASETNCLVQSFTWCCGDPDAVTNQDCVVCRSAGDPVDCDEECDADIADIVIADNGLDPKYPQPCVPVDRGNYSSTATYYVNEWVQWAGTGGDGNFYICIKTSPAGTLPSNGLYWRQLIDESPPSYGVGCSGLVAYSNDMSVHLSLFDGEWYLTFSFGMVGSICGASVAPVSGDFPFNLNLGADPTGDYHYESGLGGTPTTPGNLIADINIAPVS
jgi:hypothetical protein